MDDTLSFRIGLDNEPMIQILNKRYSMLASFFLDITEIETINLLAPELKLFLDYNYEYKKVNNAKSSSLVISPRNCVLYYINENKQQMHKLNYDPGMVKDLLFR